MAFYIPCPNSSYLIIKNAIQKNYSGLDCWLKYWAISLRLLFPAFSIELCFGAIWYHVMLSDFFLLRITFHRSGLDSFGKETTSSWLQNPQELNLFLFNPFLIGQFEFLFNLNSKPHITYNTNLFTVKQTFYRRWRRFSRRLAIFMFLIYAFVYHSVCNADFGSDISFVYMFLGWILGGFQSSQTG